MGMLTKFALITTKLIAVDLFLRSWLVCLALKSDESSINQVHLIFRDEFSVPSETYTNDPNRYINQAWGLPAGELTEEGKRLMLKLGRNIRRQKYPHFPKSDTFNPGDIYVRSIDTNRNILSAQMLLGGFYDTELDLKKAVPVHSSPSTQDKLLFDYDCPFYEKLLAEQYESASESLSEGGFLDQLTNYTGSPVESFDDIISLHAILHAQQRAYKLLKEQQNVVMKIQIPTWLQESTKMDNKSMSIWKRIKYTAGLAHGLNAKTTNMQRFHGGLLLNSIADCFDDYVNGVKTSPMLYFYSVESVTFANILTILETFNGAVPDYGETIAIELHKIGGVQTIKILTIQPTDTDIQVKPVKVPGCDNTPCPLGTFQNFARGFTISNLDEECQLPMFQCILCNNGVVTVITSLSVMICVLVAILLLIGVFLQYRKKREDSNKKLEAQYHFHEKGQPWTTLSSLQNANDPSQ